MPVATSLSPIAGIRGELHEIALPSLLCVLESERKTGILVLVLEPDGEKAALYLREGRVVRAHRSGLKGPQNAEVLYGLLGRTRGTFEFRPARVVLDDRIQCSTTQLILEGARRLGEAKPVRRWEGVAALLRVGFILAVLSAVWCAGTMAPV